MTVQVGDRRNHGKLFTVHPVTHAYAENVGTLLAQDIFEIVVLNNFEVTNLGINDDYRVSGNARDLFTAPNHTRTSIGIHLLNIDATVFSNEELPFIPPNLSLFEINEFRVRVGIDGGSALDPGVPSFSGIITSITLLNNPSCSAAQAFPAVLWAPNHQFVPIAVMGVTHPDGDSVTLTVTGVTQDEPVKGAGGGNTSPDAVIEAGAASVRAERSNTGNGRVYEVSFKAEDSKGGSCTSTVKVSVPHSLKKGLMAIDDGQAYDSTVP